MEPYLPHELMYRPKMGFAVPLALWFRGPLKVRVREAVLGPRLAATGWFNETYLRHLVDAHQSGARDYSAPLWTLLMFEAFLRTAMGEHDVPTLETKADLGEKSSKAARARGEVAPAPVGATIAVSR